VDGLRSQLLKNETSILSNNQSIDPSQWNQMLENNEFRNTFT
jgi:hypothetical protein